jgi:protein phosphatase 2C
LLPNSSGDIYSDLYFEVDPIYHPKEKEGAAVCCEGIEKLDLAAAAGGAGVAGSKRSVYLMDCASTRGRSAEMEDACAAAPQFADVPERLLASRRDVDGLGLDANALRLPAHLFRSSSASRGEGRRH